MTTSLIRLRLRCDGRKIDGTTIRRLLKDLNNDCIDLSYVCDP